MEIVMFPWKGGVREDFQGLRGEMIYVDNLL